MKVAVAYKDGEIYEHFGHAECFAIYTYEGETTVDVKKQLFDVSDRHGHKAMADFMLEQDVDAVIAGNMGGEAKALLLSHGIIPVAGFCGDADTASDLLVTGQLPIMGDEGSCGGGCGGGCGGCCGSCGDEGEGGDCGCGGGCCGHGE